MARKRQPREPFTGNFTEEWISGKMNREAIEFTEKLGKYIAENGLTTSQIRNFFGEVKRIQAKGFKAEETSFLLLKPKLAYASKRAKSNAQVFGEFRKYLDKAHDAVEPGNTDQFNNYVDFLESILAYHKAFGGKS